MAEENKNDQEAVQELLAWAQETLNNKAYPAGEYQVNKSTKILDCAKYLDSMISVISKNWENPTFHPTIDLLREFRSQLEQQWKKSYYFFSCCYLSPDVEKMKANQTEKRCISVPVVLYAYHKKL